MKGRAILLVALLLASIPAIPESFLHSSEAGSTTNFGNSGFPQSVNVTFNASGYDSSTNFTLAANGVVNSAMLDVRGWQNSMGISPRTIGIDVGDDGDLEWSFGGEGNGSFGLVNELSNGWERVGLNLSSGYNKSYSIRLPINASVTSAKVNLSTLSELTLSGADAKDSYLHKPNPSWGNSTHRDCNYGNSTFTLAGKSEWANWHIYRGVYWFNLTQLPAVTVLDANLSFWVDDVVNNANTGQPVTAQHTYSIYPLLKDWEEGEEVNLPPQQVPGVTWNNAIDNTSGSDYAWTSAGASASSDKGSAVDSVTDSPANLEQTWLDYNSQALTDLVQSWANGSATNQGFLLIGDETTSKPDGSYLKIMSRENSTHGPRLVITFEGTDDVTAGFDIGDDGAWEWNHSGNLSNGSTTPDFSASLNSLLANATPSFIDSWGNEFVDIPLNVSGNATLVLNDIAIQYDWTPTVGISPHGDLVSELNQHLSNMTADATGNVSININVSSGSGGVVELSGLNVQLGDRSPSIGIITLPSETMVPDGESFVVGMQATSYQGLANLSWVALTPQLQDVANRPVLLHSMINGSSWVNDPGGMVTNLSGQWQPLNADTGQMEWNVGVDWDWLPEQGVVWQAQAMTIDGLHSERLSSQTTDHERRMEIVSYQIWDETSPSEGGPEILTDEWVAGGDLLLVSGAVRFLNESSHPQPGDLLIELENVSGNGTVDQNGDFSIETHAPSVNQYGGFTISAAITGPFDATAQDFATLTFNVDATTPGMLLHTPSGERILPEAQQLFNVTITDGSESMGLAEETLMLRWWVEARHDDGDGIPEIEEYGSRPLIRYQDTDFFHATFDDSDNSHGQLVSLFVEGEDRAGNTLASGPGLDSDIIHYISLVPSPSILQNATLELPGDGDALVPTYSAWLNLTLYDINGVDDLERVTVNLGQERMLTWNQDGDLYSNYPELLADGFTLFADDELIYLNISFSTTSYFEPIVSFSQSINLQVVDSSGEQSLSTGLEWSFDADIRLDDFSISLADDSNRTLEDDSYVALGSRLLIAGRVRYVAADLAPAPDSYLISLEVPLDLPLQVQADEEGRFNGMMDVLGSGLYRVTLEVDGGPGNVNPAPLPLRLQVDDEAPSLIGSEPSFIETNSTDVIIQFDLQELDAGLSADVIPVTCILREGLETVGEEVHGQASLTIPGEVSRYLVNLTFPPIHADSLDCWFDVSDIAGNRIGGIGSTETWPLRLPVVEVRPDMTATEMTLSSQPPVLGTEVSVSVDIINLGNHSEQPFIVSLATRFFHDDQWHDVEIADETMVLLEGEPTTVSFSWTPDWEGEVELLIYIDSAEQIAEQDENNTLSLVLTVKPMPSEGGLFASQTAIATGGIGLLLLFVIGMLAFALRRIKEDDTDEWEDEEELDEEEEYEDVIEYHPSETTQANNGIKDGLEWLRENDIDYHRPQGSGSKWQRWN